MSYTQTRKLSRDEKKAKLGKGKNTAGSAAGSSAVTECMWAKTVAFIMVAIVILGFTLCVYDVIKLSLPSIMLGSLILLMALAVLMVPSKKDHKS